MKKAILHIGTEKTGSTSIQRCLVANRKLIYGKGFMFPQSCGFLNNQKLVAFVKRDADARLMSEVGIKADTPNSQSNWNERFLLNHCQEVIPFQTEHADTGSTVIYSAEHLQSRLTNKAQISRVKALLMSLFDEIRVVVYLRRQDRFALSRHSTVLRAGYDCDFSFESINKESHYYDHLGLLEMWSDVFGENAVEARIFERDKLIDQDVVADFCSIARLPLSSLTKVAKGSENKALSVTAQTLMRCFNRIPKEDPRLSGLDCGKLRGYMNERLEKVTDSHGKCLPARDSAQAFMAYFEQANRQVSSRWLDGKEFDVSFDEYPVQASTLPAVANADEQLTSLFMDFVTETRQ